MSKKKEYSRYNFYVDMSGVPFDDDLYIGAIFINELYTGAFIKEYYSEFPELRSFKKKASNLSAEKLKDILDFLEKKKIKSVCIKFHKHKMKNYQQSILEKKNGFRNGKKLHSLFCFKEKLIGILYYYLIKQPFLRKNWHYGIEVCIESHLDILEVLKTMNNLAHRDSYLIHPRYNHRRIQHMLKFADFIAGAGRKVSKTILDSYNSLTFLMPEIEEYDSDKTFKITKEAYEFKNPKMKVKQI